MAEPWTPGTPEYESWRAQNEQKTGTAAPGFDIFGMPLSPAPRGEGGWSLLGGSAGPPTAAPAAAAPGPTELPQARTDAFLRVKALLDSYGLASLADFVWIQIVEGRSEEEIAQDLRSRPEYAQRFPGIEARRKNGMAPISPGEYVSWERAATSMMREAGFPKGFWDTPEDFTQLIGQNVSIEQLSQRIRAGFSRVAAAAPEVRSAFSEYFGADGDVALAAFFLDPAKAQPFLEQAVTAAEVGGVGRRFGFRFGRERATQLGQAGVDAVSAARGFGEINQRAALFEENFFDIEDFTAEGIGTDAAFGLTADAASKIEDRLAARAAAFKGGGTAVASSGGITGLGAAT